MKRDLSALTEREFDLVVVGGGIVGACAAWDASLRGLSVALVDRGDFCSGTSAYSFRMVHGGIRYLQHGDLRRIRQSGAERRAFLRIAPHLVHPLPIVIPTYGHGMKGRLAMRVGLRLYDAINWDRNRGVVDAARTVPRGRVISRRETLDKFPHLDPTGLSGAAVFHDGQMHNPPRLVLAIVRSAVDSGAVAGNYAEVIGFRRSGDTISGVNVRDVMTGAEFDIRARMTLNAAGPHACPLLTQSLESSSGAEIPFSRDLCMVVPRCLLDDTHALAVLGATSDPDAVLSRGARHLFIAPWRNATLVGVWHEVYRGDPDGFGTNPAQLQSYLDEVNAAYAGLQLKLSDVALWNAGLVPFGENDEGNENLRYGHRSHFIDHRQRDRLEGLLTMVGVRFTTGRCDAAAAIDRVVTRLNRSAPACRTDVTPVHGGAIEDMAQFTRDAIEGAPAGISREVMVELVCDYGASFSDVLAHLQRRHSKTDVHTDEDLLRARIVFAVETEMAQHLGDVVFRRTGLATNERPERDVIDRCAAWMGAELAWASARVAEEVSLVMQRLDQLSPSAECSGPSPLPEAQTHGLSPGMS